MKITLLYLFWNYIYHFSPCISAHFSIKNTGLVKIMFTLMEYFSPADRRTPCVSGL